MTDDRISVYRIALGKPAVTGCADEPLRRILAARLGRDPDIVRGPQGKPHLADDTVAFSVAHSGDRALIAVAASGPIGVDLEQHRPLRAADLAGRFFTAREAAIVAADPDAFFRIWTRKEAMVKAEGGGLSLPLDTIEVSGDVPGWCFVDLDVGPGWSAALARPGVGALVELLDWPDVESALRR